MKNTDLKKSNWMIMNMFVEILHLNGYHPFTGDTNQAGNLKRSPAFSFLTFLTLSMFLRSFAAP